MINVVVDLSKLQATASFYQPGVFIERKEGAYLLLLNGAEHQFRTAFDLLQWLKNRPA